MRSKAELRQHYRAERHKLPEKERQKFSQQLPYLPFVQKLLYRFKDFALYVAIDAELDLKPLYLQIQKLNKKAYFPRVEGSELRFYELPDWKLLEKTGRLWEPPRSQAQRFGSKSLIFCPGIAFDPRGNRLGYGQGYYDRFLREHPKPARAALIYPSQICFEAWTPSEGDEPMDWVLSTEGLWNPERARARAF